MKFHEYRTCDKTAEHDPMYSFLVRAADEAARLQATGARNDVISRVMTKYGGPACTTQVLQVFADREWIKERRPYYSVFPSIAESLLRVDLDRVKGSSLRPRFSTLLVRLAVGRELVVNGFPIRTLLVKHVEDPGYLVMWSNTAPELGYRMIMGVIDLTDELVAENLEKRQQMDMQAEQQACAKLVTTLCLIGDNPDLIKPDVLEADRQRYSETCDIKYVEKAHRKGKVGWTIGAAIEMDSHFRKPHMAVRWTGVGAAIPRLVDVKGCFVKREKITAVPQGYLDDIQLGAQA